MVNAPKSLTTYLGCMGILITVFLAFYSFLTGVEQIHYSGELVEAAVFSPEGNTLYGVGSIYTSEQYNDTLQAWDAQTGKLRWRHLLERDSTNRHISLSHDGKTLLLPVSLSLYDAHTGQRKHPFLSEALGVSTYCPALFTQDDKEIIAVLADGRSLMVLDAATGKLKRKLAVAPNANIVNLALSPDGKQLVFQQDNQLVLRDLATDKTLAKQTTEETYYTTPFRFLPDGKRFQCGAKIWTPGTSKLTTPPSIAQHTADSLDGKRFVILEERGGKNQRYQLGTIEDIQGKRVTLEGQTGW